MHEPRSGLPWRWTMFVVAVALGLLAMVGVHWYHSQSDLDELEARARTLGVDLVPPVEDPVLTAAWAVLQPRVPSCYGFNYGDQSRYPLDAALRRILDDPTLPALMVEVDHLPAGRLSDAWGLSPLVTLCDLHASTVADAELPAVVHRLRHCLDLLGPAGADHWVRSMLAGNVAIICSIRFGDGHLPADPGLEQDLLAIADLVEGDLRLGAGVAFAGDLRAARQGPPHLLLVRGMLIPTIWMPFTGILERAGRAALLGERLRWYAVARHATDLRALAQASRTLRPSPPLQPPWALAPAEYLRRFGVVDIQPLIKVPLRLRLLVAELRHAPWPMDPFADPPTPLHRAEREGRLVGAWSVGPDGYADGGDRRRDLCLPLGGIMGWPTMADEPMLSPGRTDRWR